MYGMKKYCDFSERKRVLETLFDGAVKIRDALKCCCMPLHESFMEGGEFFEAAAQKIRDGYLPENAILETLDNYNELKASDKKSLIRFAKGLEARDCDGQISNLELLINGINQSLSEATTELRSKGELYIKGSILTAAAVVLLMI